MYVTWVVLSTANCPTSASVYHLYPWYQFHIQLQGNQYIIDLSIVYCFVWIAPRHCLLFLGRQTHRIADVVPLLPHMGLTSQTLALCWVKVEINLVLPEREWRRISLSFISQIVFTISCWLTSVCRRTALSLSLDYTYKNIHNEAYVSTMPKNMTYFKM